jgi:hypothetical protein
MLCESSSGFSSGDDAALDEKSMFEAGIVDITKSVPTKN